jgi:cephalosporin hydroxylase
MSEFTEEVAARIAANGTNRALQDAGAQFMRASTDPKYSYNFSWLGRPIIQYPQDIVAMQELVWAVRPDLIVETGIAHGGSLILNASLLALLDLCEAAEAGTTLDPRASRRAVLGVDIDIRAHNRREIEAHPMAARIRMIEGSSVDDTVAAAVREHCRGKGAVLVILDSSHTHAHVLRELQLYGPLVTKDSYLIVLDTLIEDMPAEFFAGRAWGKGNNPKTAVHEFLASTKRFEIDAAIPAKLLLTTAPDGYLRCTGD